MKFNFLHFIVLLLLTQSCSNQKNTNSISIDVLGEVRPDSIQLLNYNHSEAITLKGSDTPFQFKQTQPVNDAFKINIFKDGKSFVLGSNGKLIETNNRKNNLPNIFGDYDKASFFNLLKFIKKSNFKLSDIKDLYFFKSGRWDIKTDQNVIIKLPRKNLEESLNLSLAVLNDNEFKDIKILDLRQEKQVIVNGE